MNDHEQSLKAGDGALKPAMKPGATIGIWSSRKGFGR